MSLSNLLIELKAKSGRYDLSDTELTKIINSGSLLLDNLNTSINQTTRFYKILESGEYIIGMPYLRYCEAVSTIVDNQLVQLQEADNRDLRGLLLESTTAGTPEYYTLSSAILGTGPINANLDFHADLDTITLDPSSPYRYIMVYPKVSQQTVVEVLGVFYSPFLSADNPDNKWSILRPDLLMQASMYYLTKDLLNITESTQQFQDLKLEISHIVHDSYSEENINRMEG